MESEVKCWESSTVGRSSSLFAGTPREKRQGPFRRSYRGFSRIFVHLPSGTEITEFFRPAATFRVLNVVGVFRPSGSFLDYRQAGCLCGICDFEGLFCSVLLVLCSDCAELAEIGKFLNLPLFCWCTLFVVFESGTLKLFEKKYFEKFFRKNKILFYFYFFFILFIFPLFIEGLQACSVCVVNFSCILSYSLTQIFF